MQLYIAMYAKEVGRHNEYTGSIHMDNFKERGKRSSEE